MTRPSVSFVVPVLDDATRLEVCLSQIRRWTPPGVAVETIVVDNGSIDDSLRVAREAGARVLSLPHLRVGELRNRGAAVARGDILAFVDSDHEIGPAWIGSAVETLADKGVAAAGAPYRPPVPSSWVQRFYDKLRRHSEGRQPVAWLGSGNMAVRRLAFDEVGGFDTALEACEDVDLCRKLRARGYTLLADPRLRSVHYGDPATLAQVFLSELWRGRDNIRVSLRRPWSGRIVASAALPLVILLAATAGLVGLLSFSRPGLIVAGITFLVLAGAAVARALLMTRRVRELPMALAVASAYEAGRALAFVGRFRHRRRRSAEPARSTA